MKTLVMFLMRRFKTFFTNLANNSNALCFVFEKMVLIICGYTNFLGTDSFLRLPCITTQRNKWRFSPTIMLHRGTLSTPQFLIRYATETSKISLLALITFCYLRSFLQWSKFSQAKYLAICRGIGCASHV